MAWTHASTVVLCALVACGPGSIDDGSGTQGSSGTTDPTSTTATPTTSEGSTSSGAVDGSSTSDWPSDTTGPWDECADPQDDVAASFEVTPADQDVSAVCTVLALGGDPGTSVLELDCEGAAVTVTLANEPYQFSPWLNVGDAVRLEYVTDPIFWVNRWLAVFTTGGLTDRLLVAGLSGSALDPPGTTLDAFLDDGSGGPTLSELDAICEPAPSDCGEELRIALLLTLSDGATLRVPDRGAGILDVLGYGYGLTVQTAVHNLRPILCEDVPGAWYEVLLVFLEQSK